MSARAVCAAAVKLIKEAEGYRPAPYLCPAGVWTIGYGHAIREPESGGMLRGMENEARAWALYPPPMSLEDAEATLVADLANVGRQVLGAVKVPLTDGQYGALVSFTMNLGIGKLRLSTLLRMLNLRDYDGAANQFPRWVFSGQPPKVLDGLVKRRHAERALFLA